MPPQSTLVRERGQEINQITLQISHPSFGPIHMGVTEDALQEDVPNTAPQAQ